MNNLFKRSSGVLMHISCLPGAYGIGSFGREAEEFVKMLSDAGFSYWQVLPFGPTDEYNSPYKCFSAFAGNPYFIDLEILHEKGLLTKDELDKNSNVIGPYAVDFKWLSDTRFNVLQAAYSRIDSDTVDRIKQFSDENSHWLPDYALYMALKCEFGHVQWCEWTDVSLKKYDAEAVSVAKVKYHREILFWKFVQYEFYTQWSRLKAYANKLGIKIIGDMPIYVAPDSADVWSNPHQFELDQNHMPRRVAGVGPDFFSADGQLWGNPIYDWEFMKKDGYSWWISRIKAALDTFDCTRIDHFVGFGSYWAVPADAETAKEGQLVKGPGMDLFKKVNEQFKNASIIAEDLGLVTDDVQDMLEQSGYPGMRLMQYGFTSYGNNIHLPHNYPLNCVAYTGTHDNNTLFGWLWDLEPGQRDYALKYCGFDGSGWNKGGFDSPSCKALIRTLWQSPANLVILPVQDLCGFGGDTKMNRPGVAEGNWEFRITQEALSKIDIKWFREINGVYQRM